MPEFPCDILHNILIRLPAKDLFRLKAVSKLWKRVIDDPFFVKSHIKNQQSQAASIVIQKSYNGSVGRLFSLSLDSLKYTHRFKDIYLTPVKQLIHRGVPRLDGLPAHSCNGLILITHFDVNKSWAIWNPLVQHFHVVPPPVTDPQFKYLLERSGFGYDEASDDYKVVRVDRISHISKLNAHYGYKIYSLKLRRWRAIEGFPSIVCHGACGVYLNGALHWRSRDGIIAFHLGREDHHLLPVPPLQPNTGSRGDRLDALDGCLVLSYEHPNHKGVDVWVMKDYETDKTWTKLFSIEQKVRVVAYLKSKGQVVLHDGNRGLKWLDLEDKSVKEIDIKVSGSDKHFWPAFGQISPESLVRLDSTKSRKAGVKRKRDERAPMYAKVREKVSVKFSSSNCIRSL